MKIDRVIPAVDTHVLGEPGRVIVGGVLDVPGNTMFEKMRYLEKDADHLRKLMLREPRGYPAANCNLILPPCDPKADAGYVIMEQTEYRVEVLGGKQPLEMQRLLNNWSQHGWRFLATCPGRTAILGIFVKTDSSPEHQDAPDGNNAASFSMFSDSQLVDGPNGQFRLNWSRGESNDRRRLRFLSYCREVFYVDC